MYSEYIESFFGNLGVDNFGGGRAQTKEILNTTLQLKTIISKLDTYEIDFNYVINNTSLMNEEFEPEYISKFDSFLRNLIKIRSEKNNIKQSISNKTCENKFSRIENICISKFKNTIC